MNKNLKSQIDWLDTLLPLAGVLVLSFLFLFFPEN